MNLSTFITPITRRNRQLILVFNGHAPVSCATTGKVDKRLPKTFSPCLSPLDSFVSAQPRWPICSTHWRDTGQKTRVSIKVDTALLAGRSGHFPKFFRVSLLEWRWWWCISVYKSIFWIIFIWITFISACLGNRIILKLFAEVSKRAGRVKNAWTPFGRLYVVKTTLLSTLYSIWMVHSDVFHQIYRRIPGRHECFQQLKHL